MTNKYKKTEEKKMAFEGFSREETMRRLRMLRHTAYKRKSQYSFTEEGRETKIVPLPFLLAKERKLNAFADAIDIRADKICGVVDATGYAIIAPRQTPNSAVRMGKVVPCVAVVDGKLLCEKKDNGLVAKVFGFMDKESVLISDIQVNAAGEKFFCRSENLQKMLEYSCIFLNSDTPELLLSMDFESFECPIWSLLWLYMPGLKVNQMALQMVSSSMPAICRDGIRLLIEEKAHLYEVRKAHLLKWVNELDDNLLLGLARILQKSYAFC